MGDFLFERVPGLGQCTMGEHVLPPAACNIFWHCHTQSRTREAVFARMLSDGREPHVHTIAQIAPCTREGHNLMVLNQGREDKHPRHLFYMPVDTARPWLQPSLL